MEPIDESVAEAASDAPSTDEQAVDGGVRDTDPRLRVLGDLAAGNDRMIQELRAQNVGVDNALVLAIRLGLVVQRLFQQTELLDMDIEAQTILRDTLQNNLKALSRSRLLAPPPAMPADVLTRRN